MALNCGGPAYEYGSYPGEAYGRGARHKALADQISTAAKERMRERIGILETGDMLAIARAVMVQLGL